MKRRSRHINVDIVVSRTSKRAPGFPGALLLFVALFVGRLSVESCEYEVLM